MSASSNWIPYKIPPTPVAGQNDFYALSFSQGANPSTNPSKFLQWKNIDISSILQRLSDLESAVFVIDESGSGLPAGATAKQIDICENGNPQQYWFLVWNQEPQV